MPPEEKGSQEKKSKGKVMPPIVPITAMAFPRCMDRQALLQVGEGLGFPGGLFGMATQLSQERESLWSKSTCRLDGHRCEVVVLVDKLTN